MCIQRTTDTPQELQDMAGIQPSKHNSHPTAAQKDYISNVFVALALISLAVCVTGGVLLFTYTFSNSIPIPIPIGIGMLTGGFALFVFFGRVSIN